MTSLPGPATGPPTAGRARARLHAERASTDGHLRELRHEFARLVDGVGSTTLDDEHDPEGVTIAFERGQLIALIEQAEQHLGDIEAARARLAAGNYGRYERCAGPIGEPRLAARPAARTCISCAGLQRR